MRGITQPAEGLLAVVCPGCVMPIQVRAGRLDVDEDGDLAVDVSPVLLALYVHSRSRTGCKGAA